MERSHYRDKRAVLIIDRDRGRSESIKSRLIANGYVAYLADSTKEALKIAADKSVIVALVSLGGTGFDSGTLIKKLQKNKDGEKIPVIVILEDFVEDLVASAIKAGAADYLTWPVDTDELARRIGVYARIKEDDRAVVETLDRYKKQFGGDDVGLFFTSKNGELLECNDTLIRMLGYGHKDELLNRNVEETIYLNPEERQKFKATIERTGEVKDFRVTFRRKGGEPVSILISGQVVRDHEGDVVGYRGENVVMKEAELSPPGKGLLAGLLPRLTDRFYSLFSASELLGDRYEKLERLGIGSFGEVWKVRDVLKDPPKFFVAKIPLSKKLNAKFEKEARILMSLRNHVGVPQMSEVIEIKNKKILIQEFVQGKTLLEVIERELEEKEIESVFLQLMDIVAYAHNLGIIHRDIKPENVMVRPDGSIKLLDFGAAKELKEKEMSDTVTGSRPYMSPEQIMGESQRRSDVWALGVVMYVLYTGMFPFYHPVEKVLMDMILELPVPPPSQHKENLDPKIEHIILKCLEKQPEQRYSDAGVLKNEIVSTFPNFGNRIIPLY